MNKWIDNWINEYKKYNNILKSHQNGNLTIYKIQQKFHEIQSLENL